MPGLERVEPPFLRRAKGNRAERPVTDAPGPLNGARQSDPGGAMSRPGRYTGTTSTDWLVFCRPAVRSTPAIGATSS